MTRLFLLLFLLFFCFLPLKSQELIEQELNAKQVSLATASQLSYNIQRSTGFNFVIDFLAEATMKTVINLKTKASDLSVDLEIYSGWDLLRKKAKALNIKAHDLLVKEIPISYFELSTKDPIWFKKNTKKKNQVVLPLEIASYVKVDLDAVSEVLNNLPKWQKVLGELELPIPPFGSTKIKLNDLLVMVDDRGFVQVNCKVLSLVNPASEPLKLLFSGNLAVVENKLIIDNLKSEVEDIFTKDSDVGKSFSKFLEELINPIFNFHKYEKNGLTIESIKLTYEANSLVLGINIKLLPEESSKK